MPSSSLRKDVGAQKSGVLPGRESAAIFDRTVPLDPSLCLPAVGRRGEFHICITKEGFRFKSGLSYLLWRNVSERFYR
jgi:hypothetical protein